MRRVLTHKLELRGLTGEMSGLPHIGKARARNSEQSSCAANRRGVQTILFPWHTVKVIADSNIQREIGTHLPIVFEERAPLILVKLFDPGSGFESLLRCIADIEAVRETSARNRARQVQEQILGGRDARARQARDAGYSGHRYAGVADSDDWKIVPIGVV